MEKGVQMKFGVYGRSVVDVDGEMSAVQAEFDCE